MARITDTAVQFTPGAWAGSDISPERMLPGGAKLDTSQFYAPDSQLVTVAAAALAAATSVTIGPVENPIPNGTVIHLGTNKYFKVNQVGGIPVNASNQAVTVLAIPTALAGGETGRYAGDGTKPVAVPSGTIVGRTFAERDAFTGFGVADLVTPDDEICIVAFDRSDLSRNNDVDLILPDSTFVIYENFLPGWSNFTTGQKTAIRARWKTTIAEQ